jgi:hypothetical protein
MREGTVTARLRGGRWLCFAPLVLSSFAVGGCGLAEYEARMETQQKKIQYAKDQDDNVEAGKLKMPERKGDDQLPKDDLYLRPPKGVSTSPDEKLEGKDTIAHYFAKSETNAVQELFVAGLKSDNESKFQKDFLDALKIRAGNKKEFKVGWNEETKFDWIRDDQGKKGIFDVFFYRTKNPSILVGIVYKTDGAKESGGMPPKQVGYSLASLKLGNDARRQQLKSNEAPAGKGAKEKK